MAMDTFHLGAPLTRLRRRFGHAPWGALLEAAARAGYVARGAVYVSVGAFALLAALHLIPHAEGALGAMEAWSEWPVGIALLWMIGLGLYGFAGWRALQALFDADRCGRSPKALAGRVGQAISGVIYGGLAISIFGLLDAIEDLREPDDQAATRAAVETALTLPFGEALVVGMGLFVIAAGVGSIARACLVDFGLQLDCRPPTRSWAGRLASVGYFGRGVALLPTGLLLANAGLHARASEARGLGGALDALADQPMGEALLALTAVGLIAFGLFAVVEGWLRPMRIPEIAPAGT